MPPTGTGDLEFSHEDDESVTSEDVQHWAASEIQRQWRKYHARAQPDNQVKATKSQSHSDVCCVCFARIEMYAALASEEHEQQLFCHPCKSKLQRGLPLASGATGMSSPTPSTLSSPLPKLSLLAQTEVKYQEQLRFLRQQHDILRQRQQEIELHKKLQAENQEMQKQLARQRRRQFKQLMARRHAEETRKLQELVAEERKPETAEATKPRLRSTVSSVRSRSVTPSEASNLIEAVQLRRHRIPAPPQRTQENETAASKAAQLAENAAQEHRRRQKLEVLKCYAQDLTPLIHGQKPKKLALPVPHITSSSTPAPSAKKKPNKPHVHATKKPTKIVQLAPLAQQRSNQHEPDGSPPLRVSIPRQSYESFGYTPTSHKNAPTPLTAEIVPVSWMDALMASDPVLSDAKASQPPLMGSHSKSQLSTVSEIDDHDEGRPPGSLQMIPTSSSTSGSGQRVALAPLGEATSTSVSYSSERLASLLQKYNVSVSYTVSGDVRRPL